MKKILLLTMLSLTLIACDRQDKPINTPLSGQDYNTPREQDEQNYNREQDEQNYNNDNTGKNIRDRDSMTKTPLDQSESEADRTITQKIRQAIISDSALSTNAKNIKIITIKGIVTLRGPVASAEEKDFIAKKVTDVRGVAKVDNQLEVTRSNY